MPNTNNQPSIRENNSISSGEWRVIIALLMIFPLLALNVAFFNSNAFALPDSGAPECSQYPGHCYGVIDWPESY